MVRNYICIDDKGKGNSKQPKKWTIRFLYELWVCQCEPKKEISVRKIVIQLAVKCGVIKNTVINSFCKVSQPKLTAEISTSYAITEYD